MYFGTNTYTKGLIYITSFSESTGVSVGSDNEQRLHLGLSTAIFSCLSIMCGAGVHCINTPTSNEELQYTYYRIRI